MLLERTGFTYVCVYRDAIFLELLLQKALWGIRGLLKDKRVAEDMEAHRHVDSAGRGLSVKRRLRLLYRYVRYYLGRFGRILPHDGRPLKLLVIAEKKAQ